MGKPQQKDPITINYQDIIKVLRIITLLLFVIVLSFVLVFYGVFSVASYFGSIIIILIFVYVILPLTFCFCPHLQQSMVFQPHVDASGVNFEQPDGLNGVRNFKISTHSDMSIGIWHILPISLVEECQGKDESFWKDSLRNRDHKGVIIYFHGVTGTRGKPHRKELYKVLQNHGHHIISCDYRGFGDSSKVRRITETGVVTDALSVYKWVRHELLESDSGIPVFVWGHSLGAGISSHFISKIRDTIDVLLPHGLVLESPFDSFAEELRHHSKLKIWSRLPFFNSMFVHPLHKNDITFQNDGHISKIPVPIMIMHAKDDNVVPSHLGRKLFEAGRQRRSPDSNPVYFVHMNAGKHNEIYKKNLEFGEIINSFTSECVSLQQGCWHHNCSEMDIEILCSHC